MTNYRVDGVVFRYCYGCDSWVRVTDHLPATRDELAEIQRLRDLDDEFVVD